MRNPHRRARVLLAISALAATGLAGCAALQQVIQPPIFDMASGRDSRVRLLGPSFDRPLGGAQLRIYARVQNPNPVGFTLSRLAGNLHLSNQPAAQVDLPLGLPLQASGDTVIPLDLTISFADVPDLAERISDAVSGGSISYSLRGTVSVDAGALGQPTFGPSTWLAGDVPLVR